MNATEIITDAFERLNRLSPGETLNADDLAFGLRRLNLLVDEWSAKAPFLYKSVLTSAAQTGHITLGAGDWAAIPVGSQIVSMSVDGLPINPLSMQRYNGLYEPTTTGAPDVYAHDGYATVYLYPVATGQTIQIQTRVGASIFADATTDYTVPQGYENALGAALAVRCAPAILGRLPIELVRDEKSATVSLIGYMPAILDVTGYTRPVRPNILTGQ